MAHIVTRNLDWKEIVIKAWGKGWTEPDIAYEFTGRKFNDRGQALEGDGLSPSLYADDYADNYA